MFFLPLRPKISRGYGALLNSSSSFRALFRKIRLPFFLLGLLFFGGAAGYKLIFPQETWEHLFLMTAITLSTVGYGDFLHIENNSLASWYTMALIVTGMVLVLYSVSSLTAFIVEGDIKEVFFVKSMKRKIARMQNHYIVCGAGRTGVHVISELFSTGQEFIVIEKDPRVAEEIRAEFPGTPVLVGDSSSDALLEEARISHARGLVATLSSDKDNLYLTISARMLNPDMQIASRAIETTMTKKLKKAGADHVVSPNFIGGMRIASEILRPHVVTFLDRMLRGKDTSIRVEEVKIQADSRLAEKNLRDSKIYEKTGVTIIAYSPPGDDERDFIYNPSANLRLEAEGILVFIAGSKQTGRLKKMATG